MNLFEKATRQKLRFQTIHGWVNTEDLWDFQLETLDKTAVVLHNKLDTGKSFIDPDKGNEELQLQFDVVKHILDTKLKERDEAAVAHEKAQKKQRLLQILSEKQDADLYSKSVEELTQMIESL